MSRNLKIQIPSHTSIISLAGTLLLAACTVKSGEPVSTGSEPLPAEPNRVQVTILQQGDFYREIVSNGKLSAIEKAGLYFKNSGTIDRINVRNGQYVEAGSELARLQNDEFIFNMRKAEIALEKATIDKLDALLGMGYKDLSADIKPDHLNIANIRSGYQQVKIQHEETAYQLRNVSLIAPFPGKVEGLTQKAWEKTDPGKPFCTLINDNRFTITFPLLETEVHEVQSGHTITVTPVAGLKTATGTITEINPRIDDNGLAWVKAEVLNPGGYMEGMNVKVSIKKAIPGQLVVPRQAVVLRQNREVLFRYTNGIAYWTYINVLDENESQYAVEAAEGATLAPGDTVIISNNLNLAHEAGVEIE